MDAEGLECFCHLEFTQQVREEIRYTSCLLTVQGMGTKGSREINQLQKKKEKEKKPFRTRGNCSSRCVHRASEFWEDELVKVNTFLYESEILEKFVTFHPDFHVNVLL